MCFSAKKSTSDKEKQSHSKEIEDEISKENKKKASIFKLLLLGAGDAGKSTFAKQMSLIHSPKETSELLCSTFIPTLRENTLMGMKDIIYFMENVGEEVPKEIEEPCRLVWNSNELTLVVAENVALIWKNTLFREFVFSKGDWAQLQGGVDGCQYYFTNAVRFADKNFKPTKEDMLKARRKTTGIIETHFTVGSHDFTMVDVGGQRSERRKWLHCFNDVTCVIYLTAISEYDMAVEEDGETNRL